MNTKFFTLKVAALAISAAAFVSGQSAEVSGKVPVDFRVSSKFFDAGTYRFVQTRPGLFSIRNERGSDGAMTMLPVQTKTGREQNQNTITFKRHGNAYELAGVCLAGRGCWTKMEPTTKSADKIEIVTNFGR